MLDLLPYASWCGNLISTKVQCDAVILADIDTLCKLCLCIQWRSHEIWVAWLQTAALNVWNILGLLLAPKVNFLSTKKLYCIPWNSMAYHYWLNGRIHPTDLARLSVFRSSTSSFPYSSFITSHHPTSRAFVVWLRIEVANQGVSSAHHAWVGESRGPLGKADYSQVHAWDS